MNTLYDVHVDVKQECTILCNVPLDSEMLSKFQEKIKNGYFVHLLADNLPIATRWNIEGKILHKDKAVKNKSVTEVGFEPTPPKRLEP